VVPKKDSGRMAMKYSFINIVQGLSEGTNLVMSILIRVIAIIATGWRIEWIKHFGNLDGPGRRLLF